MSDYADILNGKLSSGDAASLVEKLQSDLAASRAEAEKLRETLQEIRDKKGKVCAEYETCEHPACASSYESWALAHRVLDLTSSPEKPHPLVKTPSRLNDQSLSRDKLKCSHAGTGVAEYCRYCDMWTGSTTNKMVCGCEDGQHEPDCIEHPIHRVKTHDLLP